MLILSIPLIRAQAVAVFSSERENERLYYGIDLWKKYGQYLLIAAINDKNNPVYTRKHIIRLCYPRLREDSPVVFIQEKAENTLEQAEWMGKIIKDNSIDSVIVTTALYHLPRAFLTLLKVLQKNKQKVILIPAPTKPLGLSKNFFVPGEVRRIIEYQKKGDVATFEELYEYFKRQLKSL